MKQNLKHLIITMVAVFSQFIAPVAMAADTVIGNFSVVGSVPTIFNLTVRGLPGDIDLTPNVVVNDRLMAVVHFKYNVDVATLTMSTTNASGLPEDSTSTAYAFGTDMTFDVPASCATVDDTTGAGIDLTATGSVEISTAGGLGTGGIEEDCDITASWVGTTEALPLAGVYSMTVVLTMVSI